MINSKRIPTQIYILMLVSLFPIVIGSLLYHFHEYFQFNTTNHGRLVNPVINVKYLYESTALRNEKKWRIIQVSGKICDDNCKKLDYYLHQVQKALGKDRDRVSIMLVNDQYTQLKTLQTQFNSNSKNNFSVKRNNLVWRMFHF